MNMVETIFLRGGEAHLINNGEFDVLYGGQIQRVEKGTSRPKGKQIFLFVISLYMFDRTI